MSDDNEMIFEHESHCFFIDTYDGVCDRCGGKIIVSKGETKYFVTPVYEDDNQVILLLLDYSMKCPHCGAGGKHVRHWKNLNVTTEMEDNHARR
jgi:hypothetical protein